MSTDRLVVAARELIGLGPEAFAGPRTAEFIEALRREHPAGELYRRATAEAIAQREVPDVDPDEVAAGVYTNFLWTHFVCKLLMTSAPQMTVEYALASIDVDDLQKAVDGAGPSILSCFHYTGYPLMALRLAISPIAPLISKARVDVLEENGGAERFNDHVVYMSDRTAALRLTRALQQGRSVWVLLDVVLESVRVVRTQFLGRGMDVGAGMGKIAALSGRSCLPLFWEMHEGATKVRAGAPVVPAERAEEELIQEFVTTQADFIATRPTQWLEWHSVLDDAPALRAAVKHGNETLWARLGRALE